MAKRKPDKYLTHENWDEEDAPEEIGTFQKACNDTLKDRVIKQARRRIINNPTADSEQKSVFAGFAGFTNQSESKKFSFSTNVAASTTAISGNQPENKTFTTIASINSQPLKFSFSSNAATTNSVSKSDEKGAVFTSSESQNISKASDLPFSLTIPGVKTSDQELEKPNKLDELTAELHKTVLPAKSQNTDSTTSDEIFLQKLRSLNLLCAEWIIKHLNENLSYILTPIFDDYDKYLNRLKEDRVKNNSMAKKPKLEISVSAKSEQSIEAVPKSLTPTISATTIATCAFKAPDFKSSLSKINSFSSLPTDNEDCFAFPSPPSDGDYDSKFSSSNDFTTAVNIDSQQNKRGSDFFKFTAPPKPAEAKGPDQRPAFTFSAAATLNGNPFLGLSRSALPSGEPLNGGDAKAEQDQDAPPPVVDETITEEGSVYEKKCKVFIKKDGKYVDHGVGFLFVKLIGDEKKCQLIVRANNKLATIILNVLLGANIPVQLLGTNNVMLVCCPMPESQPTSVLLRVKTTQDAEEVLKTLNEYRK